MTDISTEPAPSRRRGLSFAVGIGGGILGLLPWVVGGAMLPLQNLWATETMPDAMPFVLLPLSQYLATLLFAVVLLGGVFAGIAVRVLGRKRAMSAWPASLGVLLVHAIAAGQTFSVLAEGLDVGSGDRRVMLYFAGMLGGTIGSAVMAQVGFWMTSRRSAGVAALGISLAAVPFMSWVARWVVGFTGEMSVLTIVTAVVVWLPAVIVGVALAWCGVRPAGRLVVWVVGLLALWVTPALFTALGYGLGMRVLQGDVEEMARAAAQVFPMALGVAWMPVVVAAVIGVVGTVVREVMRRRTRDTVTVASDA